MSNTTNITNTASSSRSIIDEILNGAISVSNGKITELGSVQEIAPRNATMQTFGKTSAIQNILRATGSSDSNVLDVQTIDPNLHLKEFLYTEVAKTSAVEKLRVSKSGEEFFKDDSPVICLCGVAGSGKSRIILEKIHYLCETFPGIRILLTRNTRVSMNYSTLYTWEEFVLPKNHPARKGAAKKYRDCYYYPNGSEVHCFGLDDVEKVLSSEWDIVYVNEAIDIPEEMAISIYSRLRGTNGPYNQLILDCNPGSQRHWLFQMHLKNNKKLPLKMMWFWHEDNPAFFEPAPPRTQQILNAEIETYNIVTNAKKELKKAQENLDKLRAQEVYEASLFYQHEEEITKHQNTINEFTPLISHDFLQAYNEYPIFGRTNLWGRWTKYGRKYVINILAKLEGTARRRFFLGEWFTAEGTIYELDFKPERVMVPSFNPFEFPAPYCDLWKLVLQWDFGWKNATVCQFWVINPENTKAWLMAEYYQSGALLADAAKYVLQYLGYEYDKENKRHERITDTPFPLPDLVISDHDGEGRATISQEMGLKVITAEKNIADGIQAVRALMNPGELTKEDIAVLLGTQAEDKEVVLTAEEEEILANKMYNEVVEDAKERANKQYQEQPYILFMEDTLIHPVDKALRERGCPTRTIEEFDSYVYDTKGEKPAPNQIDDGMDSLRMFVCTWKGIKRGGSNDKHKNIKLANQSFFSMMLGRKRPFSGTRKGKQKAFSRILTNKEESDILTSEVAFEEHTNKYKHSQFSMFVARSSKTRDSRRI